MALAEVKEGVQQLVTLQNPHVEPQAGCPAGGARGRIVRSLPQKLRGFRLGRLGNLRENFGGNNQPVLINPLVLP